MLGLSSLDPVDAEPSAAWSGTAVHDVLEKWALEDDWNPARLAPRAMEMLAGTDSPQLIRALWQTRLMQAIAWVAREGAEGLEAGRKPRRAEKWGRRHIADDNTWGKGGQSEVF